MQINPAPGQVAALITAPNDSSSVADILAANRGLGPGFDAMRVALSMLVMLTHSVPLTTGLEAFPYRESWLRFGIYAILPMFFGLSGFLVTGSAVRVKDSFLFFMHRLLRLIPALTFEVVISAFILGALVTTLPMSAYFGDPKFWSYFGNIVGNVQFELPGVFGTNPFPNGVNGNMWTLKPEYYCYLLLLAAMVAGVFWKGRLYVLTVAAALLYMLWTDFSAQAGKPDYAYSSDALVFSFFAGSLYYVFASRLKLRFWLFAASIAGYVGCLLIPGCSYLALVFLLYAMVYLGMLKVPVPRPFRFGDYSYGIYLYGFPIQQTLVWAFPGLRSWYLLFIVSFPLTVMVAMFSWHAIEKPALKLRSRLPKAGALRFRALRKAPAPVNTIL